MINKQERLWCIGMQQKLAVFGEVEYCTKSYDTKYYKFKDWYLQEPQWRVFKTLKSVTKKLKELGVDMPLKIVVDIYEYERGFGKRLDGVKEFETPSEAAAFVEKFNADNNKKEVPDWYMKAEGPYLRDVNRI